METIKSKFLWPAVTAVVSVVVTAMATYFVVTFNKGQDAAEAEAIRAVLREEMTVDVAGETKTYGQVLSELHTKMTVMEATMDVLVEE